MKNAEEILKDGRLQVLSADGEGDNLRIVGNLTDPLTRKSWYVIFTNGEGWEHMSISSRNKTPDWDTMCLAKSVFWNEDECCVEYHPRKEDYVNNHEHCLHIWKPIGVEMPTPPTIMIGFKGVDSTTAGILTTAIVNGMSKEELFEACKARGMSVPRAARRGKNN